jgi:hypothetical protein
MRVACLLFLFALLAALLAKPRPARARQPSASRFAIVRIAVLAIRITALQIRIGMLLIRYGGLVLLAVIIAGIRRRSRSSHSSLQHQQAQRTRDNHRLKYHQCAAQGWPCRGDTAHAQVQVRVRQRAALSRSRQTKLGWQVPSRRARTLRQASTST